MMTTFVLAFLLAGPAAPSPRFAALEREAAAARQAGRLHEAAEKYQAALKLRPSWPEGLWFLGGIFYEQDRYAEARDVLRKFVTVNGTVAQAWAMLGLSEFQTGEYKSARTHLQRALSLDLTRSPAILQVVQYHMILLFNQAGEHETAWRLIAALARQGSSTPELLQAAGLAGLRMNMVPSAIPPGKRALVLQAGRAMWYAAARNPKEARAEFDMLVDQHGDEPNVHYMFGTYLLSGDADLGIEELKRELDVSPKHVPALVSLALEYLKRNDTASALSFAERAVEASPADFAAHAALGRTLVEAGHLARGIQELEAASLMAPDSPQVRFALASAYRKAGRAKDAAREQAAFVRLKNRTDNRRGELPGSRAEDRR